MTGRPTQIDVTGVLTTTVGVADTATVNPYVNDAPAQLPVVDVGMIT